MKRDPKRKLRSRKPIRPFVNKPLNRCVVCLYQVGFTLPTISSILHFKKGNVGVIVFRASVRRIPSRFSRNIGKRVPLETVAARLFVEQYRKEAHALKCFDETRHWWNHQARIAWSGRKISQKIAKTRLARRLTGFKCQFCGRDASAVPLKRQQTSLKYCSDECHKKARVAAEKIRLQSDSEFWLRKNENKKRCYYRKRRERPEVYNAEIRRKLENPQYRIAKAHRTRIWSLVAEGKMIKTQTSLKYFGCTRTHLKQHLISQFKPGMTWDNYGRVWEVDHRIPLDSFDLLNSAECAIAFNWQNLRPMFPVQNRMKSNKMTHPQQPLPLVMT
jgi:hypothetical protein